MSLLPVCCCWKPGTAQPSPAKSVKDSTLIKSYKSLALKWIWALLLLCSPLWRSAGTSTAWRYGLASVSECLPGHSSASVGAAADVEGAWTEGAPPTACAAPDWQHAQSVELQPSPCALQGAAGQIWTDVLPDDGLPPCHRGQPPHSRQGGAAEEGEGVCRPAQDGG